MTAEITPPTSILDPITVQVIAVRIEPSLGTLDRRANPRYHPPEPRRVVHLDEMRHFVGGEIVEHEGRGEDQPPGERQRAGGGAGTPAARLVADRNPLDANAERFC